MVWNDPEKQQAGVRPSYCMVNAGFWGKEKGQLHRFFPWSQVSIPLNKPVHLTAGDCTCTETDTQILWKVTQTTFRAKMEVEIACNKEEMLLINYESPDGFKRHTRLWNCGNGFGTVRLYEKHRGRWHLIDDMEAGSVGCEYGEYGA